MNYIVTIDENGEERSFEFDDRYEAMAMWRRATKRKHVFSASVWHNDNRIAHCDNDRDDENIYNLASIRQSVEEDRR